MASRMARRAGRLMTCSTPAIFSASAGMVIFAFMNVLYVLFLFLNMTSILILWEACHRCNGFDLRGEYLIGLGILVPELATLLYNSAMLILVMLLASALFTGVMALFCYRRRQVIGASTLMWIMIALTWWSLAYAMQILRSSLAWHTVWASVQYLSIATLPVLWLLFAIQYSRQESAPSLRNLVWLWILPVITIVMTWTNAWHGQVWSRLEVLPWKDVSLLKMEYGLYFWIHAVYSYGCFFAGLLFFVYQAMRSDQAYRTQANLMLLAAAILMMGNILYVFHLFPLPELDITPLSFSISSGLLALALFRYQMLDLMPIAGEIILNSMGDGILVIDAHSRVLYVNAAFELLTGLAPGVAVGQELQRALPDWSDIFQHCEQKKTAEIEVEIGGVKRVLELLVSPLLRQNVSAGCIFLVRDITERLDLEKRLRLSMEVGKKALDESYIFLALDAKSGQVLDVNNQFVMETGFSREQVLGHTLLQVGFWEVSTRADLARRLREQGQARDVPITTLSRAGKPQHWRLSVGAVQLAEREIQVWVAKPIR
ncbi:MAG: hypothetical protein DDG60_01920 [Anaerolineae bacterium]|nr:MAG: hypothetical protein DDG60_01920 [Anaerolineae bacterium]